MLQPCETKYAPADLMVLLDGSGSVSAPQFQAQLRATDALIKGIDNTTQTTQMNAAEKDKGTLSVGIIQYSAVTTLVLESDLVNVTDARTTLMKVTQEGGGTYWGPALALCYKTISTKAAADAAADAVANPVRRLDGGGEGRSVRGGAPFPVAPASVAPASIAPWARPSPPSLFSPRDQIPADQSSADQSPADRNLANALDLGKSRDEDLAKLKQSTKICVLVSDGENNDSADYNGKKHGTTGEQYPETSEAMKLCKAAVSGPIGKPLLGGSLCWGKAPP